MSCGPDKNTLPELILLHLRIIWLRLLMEVGSLVKDPASELIGIVTGRLGLSYEVYWFQPPGKMKLYRQWTFRIEEDLALISEAS
tara:strand:+ start:304 stop:558 length:255 start_codon:yes stop_codon:yes gene_type:complete